MALPLKSLWAQNFYPRPPRGGRPNAAFPTFWSLKFLSTPSARRATVRHHIECLICGISIHALRKEGDGSGGRVFSIIPVFLSTPSARRATNIGDFLRKFCGISIHALREEGDRAGPGADRSSGYFYPRPPRGGRRFFLLPGTSKKWISIHALREEGDCRSSLASSSLSVFLSTPSARRAT